MNYYNFVNTILETSKSHKLVYEVGEGDIYEHLNSGDHKYPCVFLTVQNVDSNGDQMTVTGSLFYVDALLSDTSNKLQIQSTGMTTLQQIFMRLMDNYPDFELRTGRYTPFDEKFSDLCAGVFSNFTVSFMDDTCIFNDDIFEGDEPINPEPEGQYLTMTVLDGDEGTVIEPLVYGNLPTLNLQYRINSGKWNDYVFVQTGEIHLNAGDVIQWKGNNQDGLSVFLNYMNFVISGNPVALSGNVMSLIDSVGDTKNIPCDYCFYHLFENSNIKTVSTDFLPAITLSHKCYSHMFKGCTALETAPELPATTLASTCYEFMFDGCTSLATAPALHATTLAKYCYYYMFYGCTSLTTSPALPATTLSDYCYSDMFNGCTSLTTAPALPATTLADDCYSDMFKGCTSLTTAPALPATTLEYACYGSMFRGCTSLTAAPALNATTLAEYCYQGMFNGCTSLTTAPELPATTLANYCYSWMFEGCTSLTTAPALNATTLADDCYASMFSGCESLVTAPELPVTTLVNGCYSDMFYGCSSLTTAPELPATTLVSYCYNGMFNGCSSLVTAPELTATTLVSYCYNGMFNGCSKLQHVTCLATDITATDALTDWLSGVASTGTFVKKYGVEFLTNSPSGIPSGWTVEEIDAPIPPEPEGKYMTITVDDAAGETVIHPNVTGSLPNLNLQYRINNGNWTDFIVGTTADIQVVAGDVVQWKGNNPDGISTSYNDYLNFVISDNVHLSGNIMSLIDGVGETLVIPNKFCFYYLFYTSEIKTVSSDFLPATTLKEECYRSLFAYCRNLTQAPALPSTTLKSYCYSEMFSGCSALKQAPELPATTLVDNCYNYMFNYCNSLNYVKCLATDNISTSTLGWLSGVSSTGTFVKPAGVSYETGDSGIPEGWTIQNI